MWEPSEYNNGNRWQPLERERENLVNTIMAVGQRRVKESVNMSCIFRVVQLMCGWTCRAYFHRRSDFVKLPFAIRCVLRVPRNKCHIWIMGYPLQNLQDELTAPINHSSTYSRNVHCTDTSIHDIFTAPMKIFTTYSPGIQRVIAFSIHLPILPDDFSIHLTHSTCPKTTKPRTNPLLSFNMFMQFGFFVCVRGRRLGVTAIRLI